MNYLRQPRLFSQGGLRRLSRATLAMAALLGIGTLGFYVLGVLHANGVLTPALSEPWTWGDCAYMTVITISTIGYSETLPVPGGDMRAFGWVRGYTVGLVLLAMLLVGYAVSSATAFFIEGDLQRFWWRRRARLDAKKLTGHYVVCGCGVTGQAISEELIASGHRVVGIDTNEALLLDDSQHPELITIHGDATEEDSLSLAGIERATGLATCLPDDKDNLYLMITARQLNPDLRIVTLASSEKERAKLIRAGADAVVSSATIGGLRIASELARPAVVSFLDVMLRGKKTNVRFAELGVGKTWDSRPLSEVNAPLPILALQRPNAEIVYNPPGESLLRQGDVLVTMGPLAEVEALRSTLGTA